MQVRTHLTASWYLLSGRRADAMDAYHRILAVDSADPSALPMLLGDLRRAGDVERVADFAQRALAAMPDNFFALDALAWARIQQGRHSEAKAALEQAITSLDGLKVDKPFGWRMRIAVGVARFVSSFPGVRRRISRIPSAAALGASASRDLTEWRGWARQYLTWYASEFSAGK